MTPLIVLGLASLGFAFVMASVAGGMVRGGKVSRRLSRKVFHAGVFSGAVPAHLLLGFWGVVVYGSVFFLIVLFASWRGAGLAVYDALARDRNANSSRRDVLAPLLATAFGGALSALLVGNFAVVGYLVCGWGDAAGEPVGDRWGRHRYSSPFAKAVGRTRSMEGSLAVFLAGSMGAVLGLTLMGFPLPSALAYGFLCGIIGALAEGISPSGTDNFWVQLLPALSGWWFLG